MLEFPKFNYGDIVRVKYYPKWVTYKVLYKHKEFGYVLETESGYTDAYYQENDLELIEE